MRYIKLNENIALAKSILRKNGITEDNEDYLKIREMVGTAFSYVGILTRLRFVDNVTDMEELKSIFEVLRDSKLDLGKLNKMSYDQILDTFYDQMTSPSKEDYELIYKDNSYSFFRVYTYKRIYFSIKRILYPPFQRICINMLNESYFILNSFPLVRIKKPT